jgi:AraC-like DNA-binding protein
MSSLRARQQRLDQRLAAMPREPAFRTGDLKRAHAHMCGAFGEHRASYLSREHNLDFHLCRARVGPIAANSLQYGGGVMISDALLRRYYLLQFTLSGECHFWQNGRQIILPAQSIAIVNPDRTFNKMWLPDSRQLLLQIDERLVQREFCAWTGSDEAAGIEFDLSPIETMANAGALARYVRMLCHDLGREACDLSHPLVADRVASGLVSLLLTSMPHNKSRAIAAAADRPVVPFFVRRVEQFIDEHARDAIGLPDLIGVAGVSTRAVQMGFRRYRDMTPMAYLRAMRLELARADLANGRRQGSASVAAVANACGFGHLGRFARDYQTRFGELPSETLQRASLGRAR